MPPEEAMGMGGGAGGAPPPTPPPGQPGVLPPPTGPGPATQPISNQGLQSAALGSLAVYVTGIHRISAAFPPASDIARDIRAAMNLLTKHVPPGEVSTGIKMTAAQQDLMQQQQGRPQIAALRAAQPGGGGGQPPGAPAPMPAS